MALSETAATNILNKTAEYGKARSAFGQALAAAAATREAAMYGLGADINTMSGKVLTPNEAAQALGSNPEALAGARMTTGFSTTGRGLVGIAGEQAATVYEGDIELQERGITTGSGIRETAKLIAQEAGDVERQNLIQGAQAQVAEAAGEVAAATAQEQSALADLQTARGQVAKVRGKTKQKPKVKPKVTKQQQQRQQQQAQKDKKDIEKRKAEGAQGRGKPPPPAAKPQPKPAPKPTPKPAAKPEPKPAAKPAAPKQQAAPAPKPPAAPPKKKK